MTLPVEPASTNDTGFVTASRSSTSFKIQLGVLCGMLALALGGMGMSQASEGGAWEYWLFVVAVYASLGLWRAARQAKQAGEPVQKRIAREIAHWAVLLGFLAVLLMLERREIIDRQSAADSALLLLALSCCLAGVHFDWQMMIVGVVLTVMMVAMATLEQYAIVLWIVMILVVIGAAGFFYLKSSRERIGVGPGD
jgi:general stress protein CsbA